MFFILDVCCVVEKQDVSLVFNFCKQDVLLVFNLFSSLLTPEAISCGFLLVVREGCCC